VLFDRLGKAWAISSVPESSRFRFRRNIHIANNPHGAELVAHRSVGCVKDGFVKAIIRWKEIVPLADLASRRTNNRWDDLHAAVHDHLESRGLRVCG